MDSLMCDSPIGEPDKKPDVEVCPFLNIPVEVFLHICSFLDARFITQTLSTVCKRFNDILSDDSIWKSRIARLVSGDYPVLPENLDTFDWGNACAQIEDEFNLWHNKEETMRRILLKDIHYAAVDAVLLMNSATLCISGSRDHNLAAWDLNEAVLEGPTPKVIFTNAHQGWIWNLTSVDDKLYSCSWDATVKLWDVGEGLTVVSTFPCKDPALSITCNQNVVAVGVYSKRVMLFDPRTNQRTGSYSIHSGAVLALTMMDNYIISASEDKSFGVWDLRTCRQVKKQLLYNGDSQTNGYPMSVSYSNDILYIGDVKGMLHLVDTSEGKFNIVEKIDVGHRSKITGVKHSLGSVMSCSTDGTMRISAPTRSLEPITIIRSGGGEITKFDYSHNVLAMGTTDNSVEVWLPKSMHDI